MASATNPAKQRENRRYQQYWDQHGRRWGCVLDLGCKDGASPVGPFEYVEANQSDTEYRFRPPWLPEQKYLKLGTGVNWNRVEIDYPTMLRDARSAHQSYRNECMKAAEDLNEPYEPGEKPSAKIRRIVGQAPKPVEPIAAAMQGNPWILGKSSVPHPRLVEILAPPAAIEDEDWLDGMEFGPEEEFPRNYAPGRWELSDGTRMQGSREAAVQAQTALAVTA